jgi:hypothetical protein
MVIGVNHEFIFGEFHGAFFTSTLVGSDSQGYCSEL